MFCDFAIVNLIDPLTDFALVNGVAVVATQDCKGTLDQRLVIYLLSVRRLGKNMKREPPLSTCAGG